MKKNGKYGKRRGNHCGTLVKKGNSWMARWYVEVESEFEKDKDGNFVYDINGLPKHPKKRVSMMTGATTLGEAREFLERKTREYGLDHPAGLLERLMELKASQEDKRRKAEEKKAEQETAKPGILLSECFAAYKDSPRRNDPSERTLGDYETHTRLFVDWMTRHHPEISEVRHVTVEIANEYTAHLKATASTNTHNKRLVFFRALWKTLATIPSAKITGNPWIGIHSLLSTDVATKRPFTVEELIKVAKVLTPDYKFLFIIGLSTGLRLVDCALFKWEYVDLVLNKIELEPIKTKQRYHRKVILPIHPALRAALTSVPAQFRRGYVLPMIADAYNREPSLITNRIQTALESVGIQTKSHELHGKTRTLVGFHSLRHFVSTWLQNARVPYSMVEKMLGHSPVSMTGYYYHENLEMLQKAIAVIPTLAEFSWSGMCLPVPGGETTDVAGIAVRDDATKAKAEITNLLNNMSPETLKATLIHLQTQSIAVRHG